MYKRVFKRLIDLVLSFFGKIVDKINNTNYNRLNKY